MVVSAVVLSDLLNLDHLTADRTDHLDPLRVFSLSFALGVGFVLGGDSEQIEVFELQGFDPSTRFFGQTRTIPSVAGFFNRQAVCLGSIGESGVVVVSSVARILDTILRAEQVHHLVDERCDDLLDRTIAPLSADIDLVVALGVLVHAGTPTLSNGKPAIRPSGRVGTDRDHHGLELSSEQVGIDDVEQFFEFFDSTTEKLIGHFISPFWFPFPYTSYYTPNF